MGFALVLKTIKPGDDVVFLGIGVTPLEENQRIALQAIGMGPGSHFELNGKTVLWMGKAKLAAKAGAVFDYSNGIIPPGQTAKPKAEKPAIKHKAHVR